MERAMKVASSTLVLVLELCITSFLSLQALQANASFTSAGEKYNGYSNYKADERGVSRPATEKIVNRALGPPSSGRNDHRNNTQTTCWTVLDNDDEDHSDYYFEDINDPAYKQSHDHVEGEDWHLLHPEDILGKFPLEGKAVEMKERCWDGFDLEIVPPDDNILRVDKFYNFTVRVSVRQTGGNDPDDPNVFNYLIMPPNHVFVRLLLCDIGGSGVCTPYSSTSSANDVQRDYGGLELGGEIERIDPSLSKGKKEHHAEKEGNPDHRGPHGWNSDAHYANVENEYVDPEFHFADVVRYLVPPPSHSHHTATSYHITEVVPNVYVYTHRDGETVLSVGGVPVSTYQDQTQEFIISVNVQPSGDHKPRSFLAMAHATFVASPRDDHAHITKRVDMTRAVPGSILTYQDPEIQEGTRGFQIFLALILSICVVGEIFLLVNIYIHRENTVMQLSQAPLLGILVMSAAVATGSCYLLIPLNDTTCTLQYPLIMTPITLIGCLLVGRIWRIKCLLSPAARIGESNSNPRIARKFDDSLLSALTLLAKSRTRLFFCGRFCSPSTNEMARAKLRKKITLQDVAFLVFVLVIPQLVLQTCVAVMLPSYRSEELNESGTLGRMTCERAARWPDFVGCALMASPFFFVAFMAWHSTDLPCLFNELENILASGRTVCLVMLIGIPLLFLTEAPSMNPDVTAFLEAAIFLSMAITPCKFIIVQKLLLVWKGEKVVVSQIMRSHRRTSMSMSLDTIWSSKVRTNTSQEPIENEQVSGLRRNGLFPVEAVIDEGDDEDGLSMDAAVRAAVESYAARGDSPILEIDTSRPLPPTFENDILLMSNILTRIKSKCMSGMQVAPDDLESLKVNGARFGTVCERLEIVCQGEEEEQQQQQQQALQDSASNSSETLFGRIFSYVGSSLSLVERSSSRSLGCNLDRSRRKSGRSR